MLEQLSMLGSVKALVLTSILGSGLGLIYSSRPSSARPRVASTTPAKYALLVLVLALLVTSAVFLGTK